MNWKLAAYRGEAGRSQFAAWAQAGAQHFSLAASLDVMITPEITKMTLTVTRDQYSCEAFTDA